MKSLCLCVFVFVFVFVCVVVCLFVESNEGRKEGRN